MGQVIQITHMVKPLDNPPNRIREQRQRRGLSLQQLADRLGTSPQVVSRFETGDRSIKLRDLQNFARVMGISVGDLLNNEDNPTSLSEDEWRVIDAMRAGGPQVARAALSVTESLREFAPEPTEEHRTRKRA